MIMYKFIKEIILSILMSKIYFSMYRRSLLWILEELHLTHSNTFRLTSFISSSVMFVFSDFLCSWVIYLLTRHLTTLHQWQKKMCKCCWIVRIGMYFLFRGQLILKCPFGVFKSTKNPTNVFKGNSCSSLWKEDESKKVPNWIISK